MVRRNGHTAAHVKGQANPGGTFAPACAVVHCGQCGKRVGVVFTGGAQIQVEARPIAIDGVDHYGLHLCPGPSCGRAQPGCLRGAAPPSAIACLYCKRPAHLLTFGQGFELVDEVTLRAQGSPFTGATPAYRYHQCPERSLGHAAARKVSARRGRTAPQGR